MAKLRRRIGAALQSFGEGLGPAMLKKLELDVDLPYRRALADKATTEADVLRSRMAFFNQISEDPTLGFGRDETQPDRPETEESLASRSAAALEQLVNAPSGVMLSGLQTPPPGSSAFGSGQPALRSAGLSEPPSLRGVGSSATEATPPASDGGTDPFRLTGQLQRLGPLAPSVSPTEGLIKGMAHQQLLDRAPRFQSGVTEADQLLKSPMQFSELDLHRRRLAGAAGITSPEADMLWGPLTESPEYTGWVKGRDQMIDRAIAIAGADATKIDYTDANGQQVSEYVNLEALMNPGFISFIKDNPILADMTGIKHSVQGGVGQEPLPSEDPESANINSLVSGHSSNDLIRQSMAGAGNAPDGLWSRLQEESGLGQMSEGAFGGLSIAQLSEDQRKHLMQLMPLFGVTTRIINLAQNLNEEDYQFMAQVDGLWQRWQSYWGSSDYKDENGVPLPAGTVAGDIADQRMDVFIDSQLSTYGLSPDRADNIRLLSRLRNAFAGLYAELGGERGRKTEEDVARAKQMIMGIGQTANLTNVQSEMILSNLIETYWGIVRGPVSVLGPKVQDAQQQLERVRGELSNTSEAPSEDASKIITVWPSDTP